MEQLIRIGNVLLPILYGLSFAAYLRAFLTREEEGARHWTDILLVAAGVHLAYLILRTTGSGTRSARAACATRRRTPTLLWPTWTSMAISTCT